MARRCGVGVFIIFIDTGPKHDAVSIYKLLAADIHVGGLMFFHGFFLLFSFRQRPAELAERNSVISGHMVESKCDLKMHL